MSALDSNELAIPELDVNAMKIDQMAYNGGIDDIFRNTYW